MISGVIVSNPKLIGYTGYDCSRRWCPYGDDPETDGQPEVQELSCDMDSGNFTLAYKGQTTSNLSYNSTLTQVENALMNLTTIGEVRIESPSPWICPVYPQQENATITFLTDLGDLPLVSVATSGAGASGGITVKELRKGTKENAECSNRGNCDTANGKCYCIEGYSSSNGRGGKGDRGDCGKVEALSIATVEVVSVDNEAKADYEI